ncbi:MAG TPA: helix-turn-helix transcriptional regulator [Vicinamibacteria bacterium]|nr:helix-turn-helix transcriptional regulator [Vicinamibacteria bacterium]
MARQRLPSLNARIRMKRTQLGLTGAELAQRADISPSYVSLIEKGAKVPDEDVAARIARALRDDEDLYRAWARASRLGLHRLNLLNRMEAISRSPSYLGMVERGDTLPDDLEEAQLGERRVEQIAFALPAPPEVLRIPVLAEGADPGKIAPAPLAIQDRLIVDSRLLIDHDPERLFAYDVTPAAMKHLRGVASPGDRIVFRRGGRVAPDRVCAVRTPEGVVLARVLFKGRSLLLLPGEGERDFESVEVDGLKALPGIIAGTHVLLIRR